MLIGKTVKQAKSVRNDCLAAYKQVIKLAVYLAVEKKVKR